MANPELGQKQVCPNCQAKFYDLNRRPARCPKCDTEFDPMEEAVRSRRARRGAGFAADEEAEDQVADKSADAEEDEEDAEGSTPEIDQEGHEPILTPDDDDGEPGADDAGMGTADGDDDDDVLDDDDDDSVPFIEDEDEDDLEEELTKPSRDDD
ncbi:TIGR02300 family protein [Brevundimonas guildfordensis]|uniref:TIGR02300 family protein n=1 Tax=Brevundimonas guildfordensis TaxID=2762241 RepID=A0ABR8R1V9_9CAUL|nr:TIGR02300 family protein [Brevundimonas guildfordensis]MBD7941784.1 TIGR02300 family protein [Brevundimonas guildfordensis]